MIPPPIPPDEPDRLKSLRGLGLLDTAAEERFDRITRLAKALFDVPIALISLVDADRQWFKSRQGLDVEQTARGISFCGHAIADDELFVGLGEATDLVPVRRHLRHTVGARPDQLAISGYWRRGVVNLDHHLPLDPTDPD